MCILQDALTDAVADAERIEVEGHEIYAHKGVLQSARNIKRTLEENQVLEKAFQRVPVSMLEILKHLRQFVQSDWFLPVFISHDRDITLRLFHTHAPGPRVIY